MHGEGSHLLFSCRLALGFEGVFGRWTGLGALTRREFLEAENPRFDLCPAKVSVMECFNIHCRHDNNLDKKD